MSYIKMHYFIDQLFSKAGAWCIPGPAFTATFFKTGLQAQAGFGRSIGPAD